MVYSDSSHQIIFMAIVTLNNYYYNISCHGCKYRILLLSRRPGFRVCKKKYTATYLGITNLFITVLYYMYCIYL